MQIAIPIIAQTMEKALYDIERASMVADIIELRIDYMERPDLKRLLSSSSLPKIVTNRVKSEAGPDPNAGFKGSEEERIAYLQEAIVLGTEYVDIELDHYHILERGSPKLIVSHHNFNNTPENLQEIYRKLVESGADIVKVATRANSYGDSLRMLNLIDQAHREHKDIIGLCMGQFGITTRVLGPLHGGYLTFASLEKGEESAPGQITVEELREIWSLMNLV